MFTTIAWLAPLTWGAASFVAVLFLTRHKASPVEKQPAPSHTLPEAA